MKQAHIATQGHIISQLKEAITGLESESLGVRIGALWTLERIAREHAAERESITVAITDYLQTTFKRQKKIKQKIIDRHSVPVVPQELFYAGKALQALFSLSRANLVIKNVDFSGVDFSNGEIGRIEFIQCIFDRCDFSHAKFFGTKFRRCSLVSAKFSGASFTNVRLRESPISFSDFYGAHFNEFKGFLFESQSTNFNGIHAKYCAFDNVIFADCTFKNIKVYSAFNFSKCSIVRCDFSNAELSRLYGNTWIKECKIDEQTKQTMPSKRSEIFQ